MASADNDDAVAAIKSATPATQPKKKPKKTRKPTSKPAPPTSAPVIHRVKDPGIYRAVFQDNVHITQDGLTLATADHMNVDFLLNKDATSQPSTTQSASTQQAMAPVGVPTAQPSDAQADHVPVVQPSVNPPTTRRSTAARKPARAGAQQTAQPSTQPATQPAAPIIVKWTGKLIVAPPTPDVPPVVPGDSVLELVGASAPAVLTRDGSNITCGSFRYHTIDQSVDVNNSPAFEIATLDDASNGSHIEAPSIHFDGTDNAADIKGPATAKFRVENNSTKSTTQPAQYANVKWEENCHLIFTHGVKGDRLLDTAQLDGDVHVDHPQVKMIADVLDMTFDNLPRVTTQPSTNPDAPTTSAQLRSMDADGNVDCTLTDSSNRMQNIQTDHMVLHTQRSPQGNNVPSELIADGSVVASDETQSLESEHLLAHLEPVEAKSSTQPTSTQPVASGHDVQLKDMHAEENVHFRAKDGAYADADQLDIQSTQDTAGQTVQIINLTGHARSGDRNNSITGPIITYDAASKEAHVIGPGTMHTLQASTAHATTNPTTNAVAVAATKPTTQPTTQPAPRPMDITWQGKFDLVDNIVTITDKVKAKTVSADTTTNEAVGDKIVLTLVDAPPTTQPTTQTAKEATTQQAATRPSGFARTGDSNFMKDKVVDTATLTALPGQNVEVNSLLLAPTGGILRAMNLLAPIVIYDKTHEQFRVPTPGRLLVRDNRSDKPATAPGAAPAPAPANNAQANGAMPAGGGMHGTTAFEWHKSLVYDEKADTAIMDGDVHIVHEDPKAGPNAGQYEIYTDRVTAEIEPNPTATTKASGDQSFRIKRLHAQGNVRMTSTRVNFDAAECDYDPQTQTMTAHSNPHEPAHVLDAQGLSTGSFGELIYNTQTGEFQMKDFHANIRKH